MAVGAVELLVLGFAGMTIPLHYDTDGVRWALGRMWHVGRNEEALSLPDDMVDDLLIFDRLDADVTLELVEVLLGVALVEVVAGVGPANDHDEEVLAKVEVLVAHRWLELISVLLDPLLDVDWREHGICHGHGHALSFQNQRHVSSLLYPIIVRWRRAKTVHVIAHRGACV